MTDRKIQVLRNLIEKSSNDNNGDLIHKYIRNETDDFTNLYELPNVMELIYDVSLFAGCREYLRLQEMAELQQKPESSDLDTRLQQMVQYIVNRKKRQCVPLSIDMYCEMVLAFYTIGDCDSCIEFFREIESPATYIYNITCDCIHDDVFSKYINDIVIFLLNATKYIDDCSNSKCIRSIRFDYNGEEYFNKQKGNEIRKLAQWYYQHEQYMSLAYFMIMLEGDNNYRKYRCKVYDYIGISKEDFLEQSYMNGSEKALDLFFTVKFNEEFPTIDVIMPMLELGTSASVFCIVHQCFRKITDDGYINDKVKQILYGIKNGIREGKISFDFTDEYNDHGIENRLMKRYIERIFQMLCRNKEDVKAFISMISYFNIFSNADLRLDYNISKDFIVKNSDWQQEYAYICERYQAAGDVTYIVMNTYLRFYIDMAEFYQKYSDALVGYWFPGYITNSGKVKLFQQRYNSEFAAKRYYIVRNDSQRHVKKKPEELQYIRFKIESVNLEYKKIYINELQTISSELKRVISKVINASLMNGNIMKAFYYLKSFESTEQNLFRHDRYTAVGKYLSGQTDIIKELFEKSGDQYKQYLSYIYLNSNIKTSVPLNSVTALFDRNTYLLGELVLSDNIDYEREEYYYIRPNYYNPDGIMYRICKDKVSRELNCLIFEQFQMFKDRAGTGSTRGFQSVRVCFYVGNEDTSTPLKEADKMCLHCCEREISNLSAAFLTYYLRIYRIDRSGISKSIIKKFMNAYRGCANQDDTWFNDEWKDFCHVYLKLLHGDISAVYENPKYIHRWRYKDYGYHHNNIFVATQEALFDGLSVDKELKQYIKEDEYYSLVLEDLKSCQDMKLYVYEKTVFCFLFDSYDEFCKRIADL